MMTRLKKLIDKINYKLVIYNLKKVELVIAETLKMQLSPWRVRISVSSSDFHSGKRGSIPLRGTKSLILPTRIKVVAERRGNVCVFRWI